ncbi:hypothetical protein U1Q18_024928 [Sarracenia purpurea var. burkii]
MAAVSYVLLWIMPWHMLLPFLSHHYLILLDAQVDAKFWSDVAPNLASELEWSVLPMGCFELLGLLPHVQAEDGSFCCCLPLDDMESWNAAMVQELLPLMECCLVLSLLLRSAVTAKIHLLEVLGSSAFVLRWEVYCCHGKKICAPELLRI